MVKVQAQIVTYNSAASIVSCLDHLLAQRDVELHVLVIDNASEDDTVDCVRAAYQAVTIWRNERNLGYAGAHNQGFAQAWKRGVAYVLTLNPDVRLEPDYLSQAIAAFTQADTQDGKVAAVTGKLLRTVEKPSGQQMIDSAGLQMEAFYHVRDRGSGEVDRGQYEQVVRVWGVCGAAAVYRGDFLQEIARYGPILDESFFVYKEDVDLCWRAGWLGWTCLYTPAARAVHDRGWQVGRGPSDVALAHSFANQIALLQTYACVRSPKTWMAVLVEWIRLVWLWCRRPPVAVTAVRYIRQHGPLMRRKRQIYHGLRRRDSARSGR